MISTNLWDLQAQETGLEVGQTEIAEGSESSGIEASAEEGVNLLFPPGSKLQLRDLDDAKDDRNGVLYERWYGVSGNRTIQAKRIADKTKLSMMRGVATSLEFPPNDGVSYAGKIRGYVVAPKTGKVRFVVSSDDNSEFWIAPGKNPFSRRRSAWILGDGSLGSVRPGDTGRYSSQWSAPISVEQGKSYYIEVWHKQATSKDHLSVRWQFENDKEISKIPASALRPWRKIETDADDDGLPDAWQMANGLADRPDRGSWDDSDGDGVCNFDEFVAGTKPLDAAPVPGMLLWETWQGIYGNRISDLVKTPRYAGSPDSAVFIAGGSTPSMKAGNYGSRLSGLLVPKESGDYQLAVAGDESTELWFSDSESSVGKRRIAFGTQPQPKGDWFVPPCQRSMILRLESGKSYYFEVIQKNFRGTGWSGIGWKKTTEKSLVEVKSEFLMSPGLPANDRNRDFLPDQWVDETLATMKSKGRERVVFTQEGDPDRDGLPNWLESRLGTDPLARSQVSETLIREWWFNVSGNSIDLSRKSGVFLRPPSMLTLSHGPASEAYTTDWFASRYRGFVKAPATGKYRFWIAGDDQVELWLSETDRKFHKRLISWAKPEEWQSKKDSAWTGRERWDVRSGQQSAIIDLEAGKSYFLEILHKDGGGDDHTAIAWRRLEEGTSKWTPRTLVDPTALLTYDGDDDDLDDDYLPDSWELKYKLDVRDNGLKKPALQGEDGDFDGDHLNNREEYLLGTNPAKADSDGDGESDFDEVKSLGTNPCVKDSIRDFLLGEVDLGDFIHSNTDWTMTSGGLIPNSFRGEVTWKFSVPTDGFWLLRLKSELMGSTFDNDSVPVMIKVDGKSVVRDNVYFGSSKFAILQTLSPYLMAGDHEVSVLVDNMMARRTVRLVSLEIFTPPNADSLLAESNRLVPHSEFSRTSPVCIEGYARNPENVTINGIGAEVGMGNGHWYADVILDNEEESQPYSVQFERGDSADGTLTWVATNVLAGEFLTIRRGDSLRLGVWSEDSTMPATLNSTAGESWNLTGAQTVAVRFAKSGTFTLKGALANGSEGVLTVKVCDAPDFSREPIDALDGVVRALKFSAAGEVEFDTLDELCRIQNESRSRATASLALLPKQPIQFGLVSRLGDGGPIFAVQQINVIGLSDALQNSLTTQAAGNIPGYKLFVSPLTVTNLPEGARVDVSIIRAGVMFPNGDTLKSIRPENLKNGSVKLEFLYPLGMPGAFCHYLLVYDRKGQYLGTR